MEGPTILALTLLGIKSVLVYSESFRTLINIFVLEFYSSLFLIKSYNLFVQMFVTIYR